MAGEIPSESSFSHPIEAPIDLIDLLAGLYGLHHALETHNRGETPHFAQSIERTALARA
jgi:hypothetical protein